MMIETARLKLIPMTLENLRQCIQSKAEMEASLGLCSQFPALSDFMKGIYQIKIDKIIKDESQYLFYTYWLMVLKNNEVIGEMGFKGVADTEGSIEIGYGVEEPFRCRGYATEALSALAGWAFSQTLKPVSCVLANTDEDNVSSQKVLRKCGFERHGEDGALLCWRKNKALQI